MLARISTYLDCTERELWRQLIEPKSLQFVASPVLSIVPLDPGMLDGEWEAGRDYPLKLYLLKFIPMGRHIIHLTRIDRDANSISSRETGLLVPVWNHRIFFQQATPGRVRYTDEIEIRAGVLTPFIWLFAHVFYRHRQRRWKILLQRNREQELQAGRGTR